MTDRTRFDRLSKRHRECLAGVRDLKGSKEIADSLGIEKSTVDSYLAEAVRILGARNRRDAALQLAAVEDTGPAVASSGAPDKIGGHSARLAEPAVPLPSAVSLDDAPASGSKAGASDGASTARSGLRLPFRRKGQTGNDLTVGERLIWIQAIAIGLAIGFGMLASGLKVLTTVIEGIGSLFR